MEHKENNNDLFDSYMMSCEMIEYKNFVDMLYTTESASEKTASSLESLVEHDVQKYGLETTTKHVKDSNPVLTSSDGDAKRVAETMKRIIDENWIEIRTGFFSNLWQKFKYSFVRGITLGFVSPKMTASRFLEDKGKLDIINKSLDNIDKELHKIGWEIINEKTFSSAKIESYDDSKRNSATVGKIATELVASSVVTAGIATTLKGLGETALWKMLTGRIFIGKKIFVGLGLIGVAGVARFVGNVVSDMKYAYFSSKNMDYKPYKGRAIFFKAPGLLDDSKKRATKGELYGGMMHVRMGCFCKSIKPLQETEDRVVYGIYPMVFGKLTYFTTKESKKQKEEK